MEIPVRDAIYLWPLVGLVAGALALLMIHGGEPRARWALVAPSFLVAGLLGALAGGLLVFLLTRGRPELGGFWTSLVVSGLGAVVALGAWKATLEAVARRDEDAG